MNTLKKNYSATFNQLEEKIKKTGKKLTEDTQ
jgi:hypothetical protein